MTVLKVPYLGKMEIGKENDFAERVKISGVTLSIDKINWPEFPYQPFVKVNVGYCDEKLWLNYQVNSDYIRAQGKKDQDPVWEDSCVEFFMQCDERYRNFEFNSLGVCLSAVGADRSSRSRLPEADLQQILRFPPFTVETLPSEGALCDWELTVAIPLSLLGIKRGSRFFGNFYKCGDCTAVPHFLSWAPISTPKPDFHRPEFFAEIELMA